MRGGGGVSGLLGFFGAIMLSFGWYSAGLAHGDKPAGIAVAAIGFGAAAVAIAMVRLIYLETD